MAGSTDGFNLLAGEPPFGLKLEPNANVLFKGKLGETIVVERTITNTTPDRQCFKIKCTAVDLFRVSQPMGFIEPKTSVTLTFSFIGKVAPINLKHYFAFNHTKSDKKTDGDKNPKQIWTNATKPQGVCRQLCLFELTEDKNVNKEEKLEDLQKPKKLANGRVQYVSMFNEDSDYDDD